MADPDLDAVAAAYRRSLVGGRLTEFPLTTYDRTGIPVVATVWDDDVPGRGDAHGVGYGTTAAAATVGALGEVAERVLLAPALRALPRRRASYAELRRAVGPAGVADPVTLVLPAGADWNADRPLDWVPATRWRTGEPVWVPVEFAAFDAASLPPDAPPGGWLTTAITNGLGAGEDLTRAVAHGLLELVQRDGDTVSFRALDQGVVLDLAGLDDPATDATLARFRAAGIEPVVKLASTEFACVVYAVGHDEDPDVDPMALGAMGEAAHPDRAVAVRKALLELASSRARRVFAFGPLERVARLSPDYLADELQRPVGAGEDRALAATAAWSQMDAATMRAVLAPAVDRRTSTVPVTDLPVTGDLAPADLLALLLGRLADRDVLVVASPPGPMRAAKVLVPGLEVETMSYRRIGERVARRLLERGSDLVGRGRPDRPGRLAVHLTPEATERLGGPVWLDADAVERVVGPLYPLYREPRRHAVARAAAAPHGADGAR